MTECTVLHSSWLVLGKRKGLRKGWKSKCLPRYTLLTSTSLELVTTSRSLDIVFPDLSFRPSRWVIDTLGSSQQIGDLGTKGGLFTPTFMGKGWQDVYFGHRVSFNLFIVDNEKGTLYSQKVGYTSINHVKKITSRSTVLPRPTLCVFIQNHVFPIVWSRRDSPWLSSPWGSILTPDTPPPLQGGPTSFETSFFTHLRPPRKYLHWSRNQDTHLLLQKKNI